MRSCVFILMYCFLQPVFAQTWDGEVYHAGALRKTMQQGFTGSAACLDSLAGREGLYGLGAVAGLKGEFIIVNGKVVRSHVSNGSISTDPSYTGGATLLVYAHVEEWKAGPLSIRLEDMDDLQSFIKKTASDRGVDTTKPFPFILEGRFASLKWHIIDWPEDDAVHTHEKHKSSGLNGKLTDEPARILGFYSESHQGIFTHHTSFLHLHALSDSMSAAAHVDDIKADERVMLFLPTQ